MRPKTLGVGAVVAAVALSACSSKKASGAAKGGGTGLAVYTVASLTSVVTQVVDGYNKAYPTGPLTVITEIPAAMKAAVQTTRPEISVGPAGALTVVEQAAHIGSFGRNLAVIAVSEANPHHVANLTVFASTSSLRTEVCGAITTWGNFTTLVLIRAHVTPKPTTVRVNCEDAALRDVASGTLEAALLFRAGRPAPSGVTYITPPDTQNIVIPFSYVAIGNSARVTHFQQFLATPAAQRILTSAGYLP